MKIKEEYVESIRDQLATWKTEITSLMQKAESAETELKDKFHHKFHEVEDKLIVAESKAKELEEVGHESWEEMKIAYEEIRHEIEENIAHAQLPPH